MDVFPTKNFRPIEVTDPGTGQIHSCFLVKYEKEKYKTARIGTLVYYRNIEGNQADPLDGRVEGVVFSPGEFQRLSPQEMLLMSGGSIQAEGGAAFGKTGIYQDEKTRRCHNAYVYCCSMEFGIFPSKERMAHFKAREHFVIDKDEKERLICAVVKEIAMRGRTAEGKPFDPEIHFIKSWNAPVRYRNRRMAKYELPFNALDFFIYQKDPQFLIEQEYRFTWMLFEKSTNKPVDVAPEPIDIPKIDYWGAAHIKKLFA